MKLSCGTGGFTLIEMIIVIVILAGVGLVIGAMIGEGTEGYVTSRQISEITRSARFATERMAREIREMDNASITVAGPAELRFKNPYNTSIVARGDDTVAFRLSGETIQRSGDNGSTWADLAEGVTNSVVFTYYRIDSSVAPPQTVSFSPVSPFNNIEWLEITVSVRKDGRSVTQREMVYTARDRL